MVKLIKLGIIISCIVILSDIACFAQQNDLQDISTPESSKMIKNQNGLISSTEMQVYQEEKSSELGKGKTKTRNISRKWKTINTPGSLKVNTRR